MRAHLNPALSEEGGYWVVAVTGESNFKSDCVFFLNVRKNRRKFCC
jgi:hypothetical protein